MHNFNSSLEKGKEGEALFASYFPHLIRLSGYQSDFINPRTGATYELKNDRRSTIATTNIFLETISNRDKGTPGGAYQANKIGTDYFVYMFADKVALIFSTKRLAAWVKANEAKYKHINIYNNTHVTVGIIVPRIDLKRIARFIKISV